eukprot:comp20984_c0_seq1/m.28110 comp20984_c0_seq1/g.28110  ORF comp20984_c0_seq1/g.28110 comp20984_c0_seq1/m.28110 type:complete len:354 (-) comp20984_c0_seq1:196-1257(-)
MPPHVQASAAVTDSVDEMSPDSSPKHICETKEDAKRELEWYEHGLQALSVFIIGNLFCNCLIVFGVAHYVLSHVGIEWMLLPFVVIYFVNVYTSKAHITGEKTWDFWRGVYTSGLITEYFPMRVLSSASLPPTKQYVFGFHPHGIHCLTMFELCYTKSQFHEKFPGLQRMVGFAATIIFRVPIVREFFLWGNFRDISREVVDRTLAEGNHIYLVVGGEAEALLTENGREQVVLSNRKGFIRLALKHGSSLVPTYSFGLNDIFTTSSKGLGWRKWLAKTYRICLCLFWGRWGLPMPYRIPLYLCIGDPIDTPKIEDPSEEIVNEYHRRYVEGLQRVFDQYKGVVGCTDRKLEIL